MRSRLRYLSCVAVLAATTVMGCGSVQSDSNADLSPSGRGIEKWPNPSLPFVHDQPRPGPPELIILHTNDLHDHLMGFGPNSDYSPGATGDDKTVGGFARLAALIEQQRAAADKTPVLLLDAGDFMMGSLFSWLALDQAPVLTLMQQVGYDAITIGNHELDWTPDGLAGSLATAVKGGFAVPVVASNLVFSRTDSGDDNLQQFARAGLLRRWTVKTLRNGVKVGIFGLMGRQAAAYAPLAAPLTFADQITVARQMVKQLRDGEGVDLVLCLSHSGVDAAGQGEDADLAQQVPGIDVIVSGHTHVALHQPVRVGQTTIVQAGAHGRYLGRLKLAVRRDGRVKVKEGRLLPVDDSVAASAAIQARVEGYIKALDGLLQPAGLGFRQPVAETEFDMTVPRFEEAPLGNLVTDAFRTVIDALQPKQPLLMTFEANGDIYDPLRRGSSKTLWFADLYRVLPMGIGPDQQPGYPLVTFWLTGSELKQGFELIANAKDVLQNNDYFLQVSGVTVTYDATRPPFDRIIGVRNAAGPVDLNGGCYKVGTNYYLAVMLSNVSMATGGAIDIHPRGEGCSTMITDVSSRIVDRDPATAGIQELKQWQALATYVSQLPDRDSDGIPDIPRDYATTQGRIVAK